MILSTSLVLEIVEQLLNGKHVAVHLQARSSRPWMSFAELACSCVSGCRVLCPCAKQSQHLSEVADPAAVVADPESHDVSEHTEPGQELGQLSARMRCALLITGCLDTGHSGCMAIWESFIVLLYHRMHLTLGHPFCCLHGNLEMDCFWQSYTGVTRGVSNA